MITLLAAFVFATATATNRVATLPVSAITTNGVRVVNLAAAPLAVRESCGYYNLDESKPQTTGVYFTLRGYERVTGGFRALWDAHPITPPVPSYGVNDLVYALMTRDKWSAAKALLEANDMLEVFLTSPAIQADNPLWTENLPRVKAALGLTDDEVAAILKEAEL